MITLPSNWSTTKDLAGYSVRYLIEIPALNLWLWSGATQSFAGPWLMDEGQVMNESFLMDAEHGQNTYQAIISSMGTLSIALSESSDIARVSNLTVSFLNHELFSNLVQSSVLDNNLCWVRVGFDGRPYPEYIPLARGIVDSYSWDPEAFALNLTNGRYLTNKTLSVAIGAEYFPSAPQESKSKHIPLLIGNVVDAEAIQVNGAAEGSLAFAMTNVQTTFIIREFGAAFPETGTVTIESETGITYTSRRVITLNGISYLYFSGVTRGGGAATHAIDKAVTLTSATYEYLIGYEIGAIGAVRNDGTLLSTSAYTFVKSANRANQAVSLLQFTSQQGRVTVDTVGTNVSTSNKITNGGFETGSTSGWTLEAGGTAAVDATPIPIEGSYQLDLTGVLNSYRALYQDVDVATGQEYQVSLYYRNEAGNLMTNGGFETGDMTGWVIDQNIGAVATVTQAPPGSLEESAEGDYALAINATGSGSGYITFHQDVTVSNATLYSFSFFQESLDYRAGGMQLRGQIFYKLGTNTNPSAYLTEQAVSPTIVNGQSLGWTQVSPVAFTTTSVTFRVTVTIELFFDFTALGGGGGGGGASSPQSIGSASNSRANWRARLDNFLLQLGGIIDTSEAALALGTTSNATAYSQTALPLFYKWTGTNVTVTPTQSPLRMSLQSRYTGTSAITHFDNVSLNKVVTIGGSSNGNPIAAMSYVIDNFLPLATRDETSFATAFKARANWRFAAYLPDPGDSDNLLQRMAYQCGCYLFEDAYGKYKVVAFNLSAAAIYEFERETNIVSISAVPEPIDNIYTKFIVHYGRRVTSDNATGDFSGTAYCDSNTTTSEQGAGLIAYCTSALNNYRREHVFEYFAEFIDSFYTANLLLDHLVKRHTTRKYDLHVRSWLNAAHLEVGDVVIVLDPIVPYETQAAVCEVREKTVLFDTGEVDFVLRTIRQAGIVEPWEPDLGSADLTSFDEPWEA
jgi:hypothetical protein